MTWDDMHTGEAPVESAPPTAQIRRPDGLRRALLTAGIAGALLVTGGVAVVFAASPEPSTSPAPSATTGDPSNGGTTAPSNGGTTAPSQGTQGHAGQPCPDGNGNGSGGSSGSGGQSTQPSPSTATPAT
jgi:hypothetical protein